MFSTESNRVARILIVGLLGGAFAIAPTTLIAGLLITFDAPGVQQTTVTGTTTETFDSGATSTIIGTYTIGTVIPPQTFFGVFGGAFGTPYLGVFDEVVTLDLNSPQKYFGMWWSAVDSDNLVQVYDNSNLLTTISAIDLVPLLTPNHFGNPNTGENAIEPYVYLHFAATGSTEITQVRFTNADDSFLETDNHSITNRLVDPPGTEIVPEPSTACALVVGLVSGLGINRRRRS